MDIRLPIGILFSVLGCILAAYGLLGDPSRYRQSLGININLQWGTVLLVFGLGMFLLGKRGMRSAKREHAARSSELSLKK
ncbi:MAG: hypothetical protein DMG74_13795 [Acidobacteria bacterium]|nr:MAG: hypothetical protein DMG75_08515 [Acidobacteriota bacterium]PYX64292.1 MAG: hypothetical protein DMG74_13795 [Acidobacteriota bacterium]